MAIPDRPNFYSPLIEEQSKKEVSFTRLMDFWEGEVYEHGPFFASFGHKTDLDSRVLVFKKPVDDETSRFLALTRRGFRIITPPSESTLVAFKQALELATPRRVPSNDTGGFVHNQGNDSELIAVAYKGIVPAIEFSSLIEVIVDIDIIEETIERSMDGEVERLTELMRTEQQQIALAETILANYSPKSTS
jgi:hypothetical protein